MKRILAVALLACTPAHAADPAMTYADWKYLRDPNTPAISFSSGLTFLNRHGDWPDIKLIRIRTEEAALREGQSGSALKSFCAAYPPITGRGMIACVAVGIGGDTAVKQAWKQGDFSPFEEKQILGQHRGSLSNADHEARVDRLLYERKSGGAQRMLPMLSSAQQKLAEARIALQTGAGNAPIKLKAVPASLQDHPGLTLDRIRFRNKRGLNMEMRELFANGPIDPPYADEWWPLRAIAVREALQAAQYRQAQEIIRRHGALKTEFLAEALWLKGWIGLTYQNNAGDAYKDFYRLYNEVITPVSKSRAAYWAARAAKKNGNGDIARDWLRKAAEYPTVFYGQLAHAELNPNEPLDLPSQPSVSTGTRAEFAKRELPRVTRMLADAGEQEMVDKFIIHMGEKAETPEEFALLADLATSINASHGGVVVAKSALRKNIVLIRAGWPTMPTPANLGIEPALTHAITRQESEFNNKAQSHANAKGLMQLLPGTASDTARKIGLPFAPPDIWDPTTNVTLGSAYLGRMIAAQGDSYILGIASYNAGPRNANNWVADFGRPPGNAEDAIQWIENIPFGETRNYVQRVLENLQVYRQLLKQSDRVKLAEDLRR